MKVGLAINFNYPDYGGMLQAFATQRILDKQDIESEAICFDYLKGDINKRKWRYFLSNLSDLSIVKEKARVLEKKIKQKTNKELNQKLTIRNDALERWSKEMFKVSRAYESWNDITKSSCKYDSVIVGSDQLWLPSNVMADYYTLNWVPEEINKVCYATSFGIGRIPVKYESTYKKFLSRINHLSAREISGQEIIKHLCGKNVPLVCDPALLLDCDGWDEVASERQINEPYIFCYFMGDNPEQRDFVKRLAKRTSCKIVALLHLDQYIATDEDYVDYAPYDVTPADFVSLVKYADYVCTDSFHGTVFSINYSRTFFTFMRFNKRASLSTNTRITSLLSTIGLEDRLIMDANLDIDANPHLLNMHGWNEIQHKVNQFRKDSMNYLLSAIGKDISSKE